MTIHWFHDGKKDELAWQPHTSVKKVSLAAAAYSHAQATTGLQPATTVVTDAKHLMKSPVRSLSPDATLNEARIFLHNYRVRHVPIIDSNGHLVGILSDRDLLREAAKSNDSLVEWLNDSALNTRKLREFMTKKVLTASPNARIRDIARAMFTERIGSIPVIDDDDDGILVGIITRSDILRHLVDTLPLETSI